MSEMSQTTANAVPFRKRLLYFFRHVFLSKVLEKKSTAKQIAYIGVVTALCIVANFFEIKSGTVQYSLTIFTSVLAGMLIGPLFGFCAVFLGDAIGFLANSGGYMYYWWVALSVATMALIAGLVTNCVKFRFKGGAYVKLAIICVLTFGLCSVLINSLGMYYIGLPLYMPPEVKRAVEESFGGELTFGIYLLIRFFLLMQVFNSVVNYALLFLALPSLMAIKPLKLNFN